MAIRISKVDLNMPLWRWFKSKVGNTAAAEFCESVTCGQWLKLLDAIVDENSITRVIIEFKAKGFDPDDFLVGLLMGIDIFGLSSDERDELYRFAVIRNEQIKKGKER